MVLGDLLGDVMVIMLAIGPKVSGFKTGRERLIFNGDVISKGSKGIAVCRKILRHVIDSLRCDADSKRLNSTSIFRPGSPRFAARCLCCNQSREIWWMNLGRNISENVPSYLDALYDTTP
jgi:hypothetical protein